MAIYLPEKIKVGYQARKDTFAGKLAYVIYFDDHGKLRQEGSWNTWRHNDIDPDEYDNAPRSGYMLNKGHTRHSWSHFGSKTTVIRIHDPRGFEFEITPENLVGILMHTDCSKREIQGDLILAWNGGKLMLLPTKSDEYAEAKVYMNLADKKVGAKELVEGRTYRCKDQSLVLYLGFHAHHTIGSYYSSYERKKKNRHIFCSEDRESTFPINSVPTKVSELVSEEVPDDFATLVEKYLNSATSSEIVKYKVALKKPYTNPPEIPKPIRYVSFSSPKGERVSSGIVIGGIGYIVSRYTDGYVINRKFEKTRATRISSNYGYSDYNETLHRYDGNEKFGLLQAIHANGAITNETY